MLSKGEYLCIIKENKLQSFSYQIILILYIV